MGTLQQGSENIIKNCMKLKQNEIITILTDKDTENIAQSIKQEAEKVTNSVNYFVIEDFGERPLKVLPDEIKDAVEKSKVFLYMIQTKREIKLEETKIITIPLRETVLENGVKAAYMPDITEKIIEQGCSVDYNKVKEFSDKVFDLTKGVKKVKIETSAGTKLDIEIGEEYNWVNSSAIISEDGGWTNLPGNEVYAYPKNINGIAIIDGVIGDFFTPKYGLIDKNPLKLEIKDGIIANVECANEELKKDYLEYIHKYLNGNRIGELGIGTNIFLKELIGRNLQDEKAPGTHIAAGNPYSKRTNAPYSCITHVDGVMKNCNLWFDDKKIMENGKFIFV